MALGNWIISSVFLWLCGFLQVKVIDPTPKSKLVYTPKWIFVLFGAPKYEDIPPTVLPIASVGLQTMGITMALYGLFIDKRLILDMYISVFVGIIVSLIVGILFGQWLLRKRPYKWTNNSKD